MDYINVLQASITPFYISNADLNYYSELHPKLF